jgi:excisionase family DNA binding protein
MSLQTAEAVFQELRKLPAPERDKFFTILGRQVNPEDNFSHDDVFSQVIDTDFSAKDAAEYLEVSMSTFRRYVSSGKINATSEMGRNQLFSTKSLKSFKRSLREVKGA